MSWIPLHVHSQFSILDSSISIPLLAKKAQSFQLPALALTDQGNLYGAVEFYKACKSANIKPILGCELSLAPYSRFEKKRIPNVPNAFSLILLAKDKEGYQNLCKLSSLGFLEGFYYVPRIDKELLSQFSKGLICIMGCLQSSLAHYILQGKENELQHEIDWFANLFSQDFYLELQRHKMDQETIRSSGMNQESWLYQKHVEYVRQQEVVVAAYKDISQKRGIPCVATNGSHYLEKEDWKAHEILMNIQSGEPCEIWERDSFGNPKNKILNPKRQVAPSYELYFKSQDQMKALFTDVPEAISASVEIAEKCNVSMDFNTRYYPVYVPPHLEEKNVDPATRAKEAENYLVKLCEEGIKTRYTKETLDRVKDVYPDKDPLQVVKDRLSYELGVILPKEMCDYLLIVYDFIAWAKRNHIPMGPGRGSGAGSIVLYLIGVTDIEPLRFNLFFERFINPERISYPDIDVDICMERRQEVIDYTVMKYGKEKVAQIITFGTMKAKMAIKDVGRVLNIPLPQVNEIAKLVPEDPNMTLEKALEMDMDLRAKYEGDAEVKRLIDFAKKLEGSVRNTGIHAAGIIISGDPLMDRIPICTSKDSDAFVTQFSMKPVEAVGMLKIDFLGLKTLTCIQKTTDAILENRNKEIDWVNLPLDDKPTFDLLNQGKTQGIFQLESGGMQDLARQLHIDKFEEIIAVGALYRPGPMEMIPSFIQRKHGKEEIEIDHPLMHDILAETYGIMVYQEQVMQIASRLAGYSLGEGDVLRRAMGKKDREEMNRQREKFRLGAVRNGIDESTAMHIFDKVEKFASYGFNKSHAAAYGFLTYVTAYLKANHPGEWMAALMTCDRDDLTKVAKLIRECQAMGISILPPDINESGKAFASAPSGIRFAITAIKGVGEGVVDTILTEKKQKGPFTSLFDFICRTDLKKIGKKVIEHLVEGGCFDFTGWNRQALLESIEPMYEIASQEQEEKAKGIMSLFRMSEDLSAKRFLNPPSIKKEIPRQATLRREKELLGFYLTGHPLEDFKEQMKNLSCVPFSHLEELPHDSVCRISCILETVQVKISAKSQRKFAIVIVSDGFERHEIAVWSDLYEEKSSLFIENQLIYAVIQIDKKEGFKLRIKWLDDLTKADNAMIAACDAAFEKSKMQAKISETIDRNQKNAVARKEEKKAVSSKLSIIVDADKVRLSHILELKNLFLSHGGNTPVSLRFFGKKGSIGELQIGPSAGVSFGGELEKRLSTLECVKKIDFSSE